MESITATKSQGKTQRKPACKRASVSEPKSPAKSGIQPEGGDIQFLRAQHCTDKAAANIFCQKWLGYVCFVPEWGWLYYNDRFWERDESRLRQMAIDTGNHYRGKAQKAVEDRQDELAKHLLTHARYLESARGVDNILKVAAPATTFKPDEFDANPLWLNCRNAMLDFRELVGEWPENRSHSQAHYQTRCTTCDASFDAPAPTWERFLEEILPSADVRDFVQKAVGYSLLGVTREQCFFVLWGSGCNGKSVFLNTLLHVFGDYGMQADPRSFMLQPGDGGVRNDLADLRGVRFVSAIELGDGKRLDEAVVKAMTGGDMIRARHLYKEAFSFRPEFKLWLATNHRPRINGTDHAIWRRVRLLPFTQTITPEKQDRDLDVKLRAEAEGILWWAIRGAVRYLREGLAPPAEVVAATDEYRSAEDVIGQFLADKTEASKAAECAKGELYEAYKKWAEEQNERALSKRKFSESMQDRGFDAYRATGGKHTWIGLEVVT